MLKGFAPTVTHSPRSSSSATATAHREAQAEAGAARSPWYIANYVTPPGHGDQTVWRAQRFERRRVSSGLVITEDREQAGAAPEVWVRPRRVARCSWRMGEQVSVHVGPSGAHFSGTERCGSVWACPVCAAVIRAERAAEIQSGVQRHIEAGGGGFFVTGTIRHRRDDPLKVGIDAVLEGWRRVIRGNPWKKWADRIGLVGVIRTVEVTCSERNGWHPHLHALVLLERPVSDQMRQAFEAWMIDRWRTMVVKLGARTPSNERGFTCKDIGTDGRVVAQYLTKMQEERTAKVGAEFARGDLKAGRQNSRLPFELLDSAGHSARDRRLWLEYIEATVGRRCFTWSNGLRKRLALGEELTEEQILAQAETGELVGVIDGATYDTLRTTRQLPELLDQLETAAAGGESGYLLQLVTPKRAEPGRRTRDQLGNRHPVLAPVLDGSRVLLDVPKRFALKRDRDRHRRDNSGINKG